MSEHVERKWITRDELAARLGLNKVTLAQWASKEQGPRFGKFGGAVRYSMDDVIAWENAQKVSWGSAS